MLLAGDRQRSDVVEAAGVAKRRYESGPPRSRINLGAVGVCGAPLTNERTGVGVADHHLARLGRRVDASDQCHVTPLSDQRAPSTCSMASWSSWVK